MPTITTLGTASARAYGLFGSSGESPNSYWLSFLYGTTLDQPQGVLVDGNKNAYTIGYTTSDGAGSSDFLFTKYYYNGTVQWKKLLGGTSIDQGNGVAISSGGDLYVVGISSGTYMQAAKYNSSGVVQWQRRINNGNFQEVVVGASGNVYICGGYNNPTTGFNNACVVKIDSSGTVQWTKLLGLGTSSTERFYGIALDSSENVYVAGFSSNGGTFTAAIAVLASYNSSGTLLWQRTITPAQYSAYGIAVASSGYLYVVGGQGGTGGAPPGSTNVTFLAKYDTSGTYVWHRTLGNTSTDGGLGVALDSSENIYITGFTRVPSSTKEVLIAKYNSSGTIQWQRTFFGSGNDDTGNGITVDTFGNMYIAALLGFSSPNGSSGNIKLPTDGTRTGTYGSFTYAESSLTSPTITVTTNTSSLVDTAVTITLATSSLTAADATFVTSTVIPL
jgi:hypothetical protein